ncbi:MAG: hypothetical protein EA366_03210 [Spirulina sp. DLM2.Bin59]|nr:MAG: hypothetical protein EA366_03210 [Spirulina sp. DLM2.Bin59]
MALSNQRYSTVRELGQSLRGFCASTLANDEITGNLVVIKQFHCPEKHQEEQWFHSYKQVLERLQGVNSTQIVKYLHTHKTGTGFSLVRDYIPTSALDLAPQLSLREVQKIAVNVLDTLIHLKQRDDGCVHANLKPSNIFVDSNLKTQLTDFGSAAAVDRPLPPNDLHNLGVTMVSLLSQQPFGETCNAIQQETTIPLTTRLDSLSPHFGEWLQTILHHNPDYHDYSLAQAKADLEQLPIEQRRPLHRPQSRRLGGLGNRVQQWIAQVRSQPAKQDWVLKRLGEPHWTEADFQGLLEELGQAGYGWLDPEKVRQELEHLKAQRRF